MEVLKRKMNFEKINIHDMLKELGISEEMLEIQVSLNSWGHLTVRYMKHPAFKDTTREEKEDNDIIVVFDRRTTSKILEYLVELLRTESRFREAVY